MTCLCMYGASLLLSRHREQQLVAAHKVELDDEAAQHRQQLGDYLGEFNRAKEMLVGEIKDLRNQ